MSIRKATFSATRWTTVASLSRVSVQLLQTALLARLLLPADFGLIAMAGVALGIAAMFADLGLSSALMHFSTPDHPTFSTLYWLNLGLGCFLALLFALLSWPLAYMYGHLELLPVFAWLALSFPLSALGQPFRVLAEKNLNFKPLAQNEIFSVVIGFSTAIVFALTGGGAFSLIAAMLVTTTANSILAWLRLSADLRPSLLFHPALAKPYIAFGLHRVGDGFWNTLQVQADIFFAGLVANPAAVALYSLPREQCLKVANTVINPVITRVGLPVMTKVKNDQAALRFIYLKTLRMTASLNFPIYAALALFAEEAVAILLGDQWKDAAFYMRIFAIWGLIRSTGNPSGSLLYAVGMAKRAHIWNLLLFFGTVPLLWLAASLGGLPALTWTMLGWQAVVYLLAWRFLVQPACGMNFTTYNACMASPLVATVLASVFAWSSASAVPTSLQLPIGAVVFSGVYLLFSWFHNRQWIEAMAELLHFSLPVRRR